MRRRIGEREKVRAGSRFNRHAPRYIALWRGILRPRGRGSRFHPFNQRLDGWDEMLVTPHTLQEFTEREGDYVPLSRRKGKLISFSSGPVTAGRNVTYLAHVAILHSCHRPSSGYDALTRYRPRGRSPVYVTRSMPDGAQRVRYRCSSSPPLVAATAEVKRPLSLIMRRWVGYST